MRFFKILFPFTLLVLACCSIRYVGDFAAFARWFFLIALSVQILFLSQAKKIPKDPIVFITIIYVLWCFATFFWSEVPELSFLKGITHALGVFSMLSAGYIWIINSDENEIFGYFSMFSIVSLLAVLLGFSSPEAYGKGNDLYSGLAGGSNAAGTLLAISTLWLLWNIIVDWPKLKRRVMWIILFMLAVFFIKKSHSRASVLILISLSVGLVWALTTEKKILISFLVVAISASVFIAFPDKIDGVRAFIYKERRNEAFAEASVFKSRTLNWNESRVGAQKGGLLGAGLGVSIGAEDWEGGFSASNYGREKGNSILAILEEIGFIGLIIYALFCFLLIKKSFYALQIAKTFKRRAAISLGFAFLVGLLINSQFEAWWLSLGTYQSAAFWSTVGVMLGLYELNKNELR